MSRTTAMVSAIPGKLIANGRFSPDCWGRHFKDILQHVPPNTFRAHETAFALKEFRLATLVEAALKGFPVAIG